MSPLRKLHLLNQLQAICDNPSAAFTTPPASPESQPDNRWKQLQGWLSSQAPSNQSLLLHSLALSLWGRLLFLLLGTLVMSSLLQWQGTRSVNLWWLWLFSVALPFISWLLSLWLSHSTQSGPLQLWIGKRLQIPGHRAQEPAALYRLSAQYLLQGFSLFFAVGLCLSFFVHLLLTDLAFSWSSTVQWTHQNVWQWSQWMALPWGQFWPDASPTLELVQNSRFAHGEFIDAGSSQAAREWWPFMLMNLLVYTLLPRLLSWLWFGLRLHRSLHQQLLKSTCGQRWWSSQQPTRLVVESESYPASPLSTPTCESASDWPQVDQLLFWGTWSREQQSAALETLPSALRPLPVLDADADLGGKPSLLFCKAWEPPLGALADACQHYARSSSALYLYPAPLPGLDPSRQESLMQSWRLFTPTLAPQCQLLEPKHE